MEQGFRRSIFNNIRQCNGFAYIHFPLIYKSKSLLCMQMYADAAIHFIKLLGLEKQIYKKIVDNTVVEILPSDIQKIHSTAIEKFENKTFLTEITKILDEIYKTLPELYKKMETSIKEDNHFSKELFQKIYKMNVMLLSVNNINFILDTYLADFIKNSGKSTEYLNYISEKYFCPDSKNKSF